VVIIKRKEGIAMQEVKVNAPKTIFRLSPNMKEKLLESAINNVDKLLSKNQWTALDAAKANIYAFVPPVSLPTTEKRKEFVDKRSDKIKAKTKEMLQSKTPQNLNIYATCGDLYNWLNLANTWATMYMTYIDGKYAVIINIIRTAVNCEYVLSQVSEDKKRNHLYKLSFDQFIKGKQDDWEENIEIFEGNIEDIKSRIKDLLRYNRTVEIVSNAIAIKELTLLYADVQQLVDKLRGLNLRIRQFKKAIENNEVNYEEEAEKRVKSETMDKLLKILNETDLPEWITKDLNDETQYPIPLPDGLLLADSLKKFKV
jgi:hypothetical protein